MDRGSTFSDPRVISLLRDRFVSAVGDTHLLQNQRSGEADWFMGVARKVNPRVLERHTAQGFYVAAPDGKGYGFNNNRDPQRVLDFLARSLQAFTKDPPARGEAVPAAVRSNRAPEASVSTLRVFSRIRPLPKGCDRLKHGIGRDHLWVFPGDVQAIRAEQGKTFAMPQALAMRLARYHLVDNVRGEPAFWKREEIKGLSMRMRRGSLPNRYDFDGTFSMATADGKRGLEGKIEGRMTLDPVQPRIVQIRAYGEGKAWGNGPYTPRAPEGRFPIVFAITETRDEISQTVPPQAAAYGDGEYKSP